MDLKMDKQADGFFKNLILGLQHLLAMYSGDILVPILIGTALGFSATQMTYLISVDIFMCGVATLLQIKRTPLTGIGLPVVLGSAVEYVTPLQNVGHHFGIAYMYGAIIAAGVFILLISKLFANLQKFFPPVVTGSLITLIGFTLIPVAFQNIGGGDATAKNFGSPQDLILGFVTALIIIAFTIWGRGFIQQIAILIGIVAGYIIAVFMGKIGFESVSSAHWFQVPMPFYFATPKFEWSSIVIMLLAALTCMIESTGVYYALAEVTKRDLSKNDMQRGYASEGIAAILGGIFNTFPYSTFSQNVAIVQLSGIKKNKPVYFSAFLLILLGLIPKVGAVATLIPNSVLGGAMLVMFGMVGAQGIKMLSQVKMTNSNLLIMAIAIGLGIGVTVQPTLLHFLPSTLQTILNNGLVVGSFSAIILNMILNPKSLRSNN
ncbi:nucleobase:cation symporter-2 family protein [Companilactobacillus sp.]|jgi:xanthine permease|uniref:nucleobase:cation symporter-2 family protein n=1 Tax=Companilactobacillus sp. TaxID=2767905 RepID=UPI0025B9A165|nr:nucleobase:cation symporter-2 family protein [Companilactobacillus sp.]MCH4009098.1 purine permease [Companilactobacillus sp.]MCH4050723.1 purine permease [Companilactobacillus sp.]MCH4077040.1 purine permease [Companilactobacillus sp.]MCH4125616.1 purine permease [Companilactobacillus sp.]MCI1311325.1 purine permease [Companilactobacillus sp.]